MKKSEVRVGRTYLAKVSGVLAEVRLEADHPSGGWLGVNLATGKRIRVKSAQRLRRELAGQPAEPELPDYDESRCCTPGCGGPPVMLHLGRPLCRACWHGQCEKDKNGAIEQPEGSAETTTEEDNAMKSKKRSPAKGRERKHGKAKAPKPSTGEAKAKSGGRISAIQAAHQVLAKSGKPMSCGQLIETMAQRGLWSSPAGKTPAATLNAAILREIKKGKGSRFRRADRGQYEAV